MRLMILCQQQFGYHSDTWYYCKHLRDLDYESLYVGWDYGKPRRVLEGVKAIYVSRDGGKLLRVSRYLYLCASLVREHSPDLVFIKYFEFCFLLRIMFPATKFVFDIRTANVSYSSIKRVISDGCMKFESFFFGNITIISKGLKSRLGYPSAYILPLGAEVISVDKKNFDNLNLIYVGTFTGRSVDVTIVGLAKYVRKYGKGGVSYTIVGDGWNNELNEMKALVSELKLNDVVSFTGYVSHREIGGYFCKSNVGVSYIPQTVFFNCQPATKTYEYLLSGMPVIATRTEENERIMEFSNGVLIDSTSDDFFQGLIELRCKLSANEIDLDLKKYSRHLWRNIVFDLNVYFRSVV